MISALKAIIKKEWLDSLRDRRSITAAIGFAISGPLVIALMITHRAEERNADKPISIHVEGESAAQDLLDYLQHDRVELADSEASATVSLKIPSDYAEKFERGQVTTVQIVADHSKPSVRVASRELESLIRRYSASLGQLRLSLRGVASSVANPILVDRQDLATQAAKGGTLLGLLNIYFLLAAFIGSMAVSIDVAAGERERNSLEVLMAQPVSAVTVFAGKSAVAGIFGAICIALTIAISKLMFVYVPLGKIGLAWTMSWADASRLMLGLLPLAVMVATLQVALSLWAKSYKEASAFLQVLMFAPISVALFLQVKEVEAEAWVYSVPLLGHHQMLMSMTRGEAIEPMLIGLLALSTLFCAGLLVLAGGFMLTKERIVFGQTD